MLATGYSLSTTTELPFAEAVERVRGALKDNGFGVLCEIDVQATLKEKLGVEGEPYVILGACNPPLAHRALEAEPDLGVLLPCNVVVYERGGETHVSAVDAERMLSIVGNDELAPVAAEVRARLAAVVESVIKGTQRSASGVTCSSCVARTRSLIGEEEHGGSKLARVGKRIDALPGLRARRAARCRRRRSAAQRGDPSRAARARRPA